MDALFATGLINSTRAGNEIESGPRPMLSAHSKGVKKALADSRREKLALDFLYEELADLTSQCRAQAELFARDRASTVRKTCGAKFRGRPAPFCFHPDLTRWRRH